MTTRFDPETGEMMFTETQVRQIVKEAIDVLRQQTLGYMLRDVVYRIHDECSESTDSMRAHPNDQHA